MDNCQYCRKYLIDYIQGGLPQRRSRHVGQHLRRCDACHAVYVQQRETTHTLENELALLGKAQDTQLEAMWRNIAFELETPQPQPAQAHSWWHSGALVALLVLCVLPWTFNLNQIVGTATTYESAQMGIPYHAVTPNGTAVSIAQRIEIRREQPTEDAAPPTPTSTPAVAPAPGNLSNASQR